MKKILVLNSGSSSLKYQLFGVDGDKYEVIAKGLADRIGIDNSFVTIKIRDGEKVTKNVDIPSHQEAIREVFALLLNGALSSMVGRCRSSCGSGRFDFQKIDFG